MASNSNPSRSTRPEKSATKSVAVGNFPSLTLMAISQAEAALTIKVFLVSAMILRAFRGNAGSSVSHQSKAWVSSRARRTLLPKRQFAYWKRLEKLGSDAQLPLQRSRLALAPRFAQGNNSGH